MKIREALALPVERETKELYALKGCYYDHVPELQLNHICDIAQSSTPNVRVVIKTHVNHTFDGRRIWRMQSVWLDGTPVMITQNAGREGDDHSERFIVDHQAFAAMIAYLQSLLNIDLLRRIQVHAMDDEPQTLGRFYNHSYDEIVTQRPWW